MAASTSHTSEQPDDDPLMTGLLALHVGKRWRRRQVLRDVSLGVRRGEAVGLLGPNGAGKTTCFYILSGLASADYGQVVLDGVDVTRMPLYRRAQAWGWVSAAGTFCVSGYDGRRQYPRRD